MKKAYSDVGFSVSSLPPTRRIQFKDQMKLNFFLYLKVGFILFLFALPLIASLMGDRLVLNYYSNEEVADKSGALIYGLIFDGAKTISLMIFSLGLAGALRIYRKCAWNEPVILKYDFFDGIKKNCKNLVILSLIVGLYFLAMNTLFNFGTFTLKDSTLIFVFYFLMISLFVFVLAPIFIMAAMSAAYYQNKLFFDLKNGFILAIKTYLPYVTFSLLAVAPFFVTFIGNIFILLAVYAVYFVAILPIYLLVLNLYVLSVFDKYVNVDFKDYQYKGLYHKEDEHE
ncbi:MAG: hypothetical protein MJ239_03425 [Bacilli bacterium]|nr:hypothetical protein [Bacilli bacterium]